MGEMFCLSPNPDSELEFSFRSKAYLPEPTLDLASSCQDVELQFSYGSRVKLPGPVPDLTCSCQDGNVDFSRDSQVAFPKRSVDCVRSTSDGEFLVDDIVGNVNELLRSLPVSDYQLSRPNRYAPKQPPTPDVSKGLAQRQTKKELVGLAKYVQEQLEILVHADCMYVFEPPCWSRLEKNEAHSKILRTLKEVKDVDDCITEPDVNEIYRRLLIEPDLQYKGIFEPPDEKINFRDGTYDLQRDEFYEHDPDDHFTTYVDVAWTEICENPRGNAFERFVDNLSSGDSLVRTQILELVSILLTGTQIKHFFVLLGESNTGKTQLGRFLGELVGRENVETVRGIGDFGDKWTMGSLEGKLLATCLDLPDKPLPKDAVGIIKQFIGDDPVKGEEKHKSPHTFYRKPLLLCAGNHPIRISNMDKEQALLNRMVVIPFRNPVSESSMRQALYKDLLEEAPYIIREAIKAYRELAARNWQVTRAEIPTEYQPEEGSHAIRDVAHFLLERCEFSPDLECATADLTEAYFKFAEEENLPQLSRTEFSRSIIAAAKLVNITIEPLKRVGKSDSRGYKGIGLRDP